MIKTLAFILIQITSINEKLLKTIEAFQNQEGIKNGIVSIHVVDCDSETELLSHCADKSVNSASILKLVSTGAILNVLGPNFKFRTDLSYEGKIVADTLFGDIYIESNGDPSLGSNRYPETANFITSIVSELEYLGIKKIMGDIKIVDPDYFKFEVPDTWIWGDIGNYYGALPHQFNFNENMYSVFFNAPFELNGDVSIASIYPNSKSWKINNIVKAGPKGSGDQVYIYNAPNSSEILMKGTIPVGAKDFEVKGSIAHPAAVFKSILIEQLNLNDIQINKLNDLPSSFFYDYAKPLTIVKSFYSPALGTLIQDCNFSSINLYADAFAQKLSSLQYGTYSLNKGAEALYDFWEKEGANIEGFQIKDGSGLSPSGLVTSQGITSILKLMYKSKYFDEFYNSIPVVGRNGTVKYLDRNNSTKGRVKAKSGSISGTRSYAGYVKAKNGHMYTFSLIVNRYDNAQNKLVRDFLENILINLIDLNQ